MRLLSRCALATGALLSSLVFAACVDPGAEAYGDDLTAHEEASDFEPHDPGKADGATFVRHRLMSDAFFEDAQSIDGDVLQEFLEATPYDKRCWLADERIGGRRAADIIVEVAHSRQINPLLLLTRMQVESSAISKSVKPSQSQINHALGCGCPDGGGCASNTSGLEQQLICAADVLRDKFEESAAGTGIWRAGEAKTTLDGRSVTPHNHATAAHYAYTPWVLPGSGGNWLVWNVLGKFRDGMLELGVEIPEPGFIGTLCDPDAPSSIVCEFSAFGERGFCEPTDLGAGYCSLPCEGFCPDGDGVDTFCVQLHSGQGQCLPKASSENASCSDLPGTRAEPRTRFRGTSGAPATTATVCVPR
jgi:hypothetical protein